jgi:hypothetical protein
MTDSSIPNAGSLNFSVDSRLLFELREELVASHSAINRSGELRFEILC